MCEDEPSAYRIGEFWVSSELSPQVLPDSSGLFGPLFIERLEHLELSYEAAAGLSVGLHPPPLSALAGYLPAPVLDLVDPDAGRANDDHVSVEVRDHQEAPYGHVLIRKTASEVGDECLLADVTVAPRRQGGPGAPYRRGAP